VSGPINCPNCGANPTITHKLGVALHRRGAADAAMAAFKKARELAPDQAAPVLGLAVSCDKLGRAADAAEAWHISGWPRPRRWSIRFEPEFRSWALADKSSQIS
jgi:hypothetical protein